MKSPYLTFILIMLSISTASFAKKLNEEEFNHYLNANNELGRQYHNDLSVALVSGDRPTIPEKICAIYKISLEQSELAKQNQQLKNSSQAETSASENIHHLEEILTPQQKPLASYCQTILPPSNNQQR